MTSARPVPSVRCASVQEGHRRETQLVRATADLRERGAADLAARARAGHHAETNPSVGLGQSGYRAHDGQSPPGAHLAALQLCPRTRLNRRQSRQSHQEAGRRPEPRPGALTQGAARALNGPPRHRSHEPGRHTEAALTDAERHVHRHASNRATPRRHLHDALAGRRLGDGLAGGPSRPRSTSLADLLR